MSDQTGFMFIHIFYTTVLIDNGVIMTLNLIIKRHQIPGQYLRRWKFGFTNQIKFKKEEKKR